MKTNLGAGILAIEKNSGKILLVLRSNLCSEPNTWANVGGKVEKEDGDPKQGAIREFNEEVNPDAPYLISKVPFFINEDRLFRFYTYLAIFDNKFVPVLNEENVDYGWFDLESLPENLLPGCDFLFKRKKKDIMKIIEKIKA